MKDVFINGENLTIENIIDVSRNGERVSLSEGVKEKVLKARKVIENAINENKVIYGVTTGFGKFSDVVISEKKIKQLQKNLIMSHACGVGKPFEKDVVRTMMLLRANSLAKGLSGVRLKVINTLIKMLNKGVHPIIPSQGSVGASGDLTPLAHMALVMLSLGEAEFNGEIFPGNEVMKKAGIEPLVLESKEGIALINGTQAMTALGTLTLYDAYSLVRSAEITASLSLEALRANIEQFDEDIQKARPYQGQFNCAKNIREILNGSKLISKGSNKIRVQDPYSFRCIPQVHGAVRNSLNHVKEVLKVEINSATDNPLIFSDRGEILSGGNFHGQPVAIVLDFLSIALSQLGNIAERRIDNLINCRDEILPPCLIKERGLNSGFMLTQYLAASLVSENKVLSHPASVDSIPTSAGQEDFVSMGTIAGRKAKEILKNVEKIIGIELLCACQAIDFHDPIKLGKGTKVAYNLLRDKVSKLETDRVMAPDIEKAVELIGNGNLVKSVEKSIGKLA